MQKILRFFLISSHKRRCLVASVALLMLRLLRDIEHDELWRTSNMLDTFEPELEGVSCREYAAIEEECTQCEFALGILESVIEDLEYVY